MVLKYIAAFDAKIDYRDKEEVFEGLKKMAEILECLNNHSECMRKFTSYPGFEKTKDMFTWTVILNNLHSDYYAIAGTYNKKKLAMHFKNLCEDMRDNVKTYFSGWKKYQRFNLIKESKVLTNEEYVQKLHTRCIYEKIEDPKVLQLSKLWNFFIERYRINKQNWLSLDNDLGLMNFFKQNPENLRGIFETCIDRLFSESQPEEDLNSPLISKKKDPLGRLYQTELLVNNPAVNTFWINPNIMYYIETMEMIFDTGLYARKMFFRFMNDSDDDEAQKNQK